jgi:hypothetical protein
MASFLVYRAVFKKAYLTLAICNRSTFTWTYFGFYCYSISTILRIFYGNFAISELLLSYEYVFVKSNNFYYHYYYLTVVGPSRAIIMAIIMIMSIKIIIQMMIIKQLIKVVFTGLKMMIVKFIMNI